MNRFLISYSTDKIALDWPEFATLHVWWSQMPNYNPIAVTNSESSQSHATRAQSLFLNLDSSRNAEGGSEDKAAAEEEEVEPSGIPGLSDDEELEHMVSTSAVVGV